MKRFEFSLDRLLSVKKQLERRSEAEQAAARHGWEREKAKARAMQEEINREAERNSETVGQSVSPYEWMATYDRMGRLERNLEQQAAVVAKSQLVYAAAERKRAQLAREVEALVTLRQTRWEEWKQDAAKADQERLDEIGVRQWANAQAASRNAGATS